MYLKISQPKKKREKKRERKKKERENAVGPFFLPWTCSLVSVYVIKGFT